MARLNQRENVHTGQHAPSGTGTYPALPFNPSCTLSTISKVLTSAYTAISLGYIEATCLFVCGFFRCARSQSPDWKPTKQAPAC